MFKHLQTIHVLGMGPTLSEYEFDGFARIGVNDIWRHHHTEHLVCIDKPKRFSEERLAVIRNSKPQMFFTNLPEYWMACFAEDVLRPIEFAMGRGFVDQLDSDKICYSNNSTFVAVVMAFKLGAKRIIMHGVDFIEHKDINGSAFDAAKKHFTDLRVALNIRGRELYVSSRESRLSDTIPVIPNSLKTQAD